MSEDRRDLNHCKPLKERAPCMTGQMMNARSTTIVVNDDDTPTAPNVAKHACAIKLKDQLPGCEKGTLVGTT